MDATAPGSATESGTLPAHTNTMTAASSSAALSSGSDAGAVDAESSDNGVTALVDAAALDGGRIFRDAEVPNPLLPPVDGGLDYQLGGGYELPQGVTIVARDRTDTPEQGAYNICYVNGFQVQPGEENDWDADLLLRDDEGEVVIDEDWDEVLLDVSTADKRERIAAVVGAWIGQCADDGFQAVEIDNLDTYTRSDERIAEDDAVDFIARLSDVAHANGLAIAQKNSVELVPRRAEMKTDFVVSEECNAWEECDGYIESYGTAVLMIEYGEADFQRGCDLYGEQFSIVHRDRNLTRPGSDSYVYEGC